MRNFIYTLIVLAVIAVSVVVIKNVHGPAVKASSPLATGSPNANLISEKERLSRMKRMLDKSGGLPLDLAMRKAVTEEQRERLKKKLAYQSQTKAEAALEARAKLDEIEARLDETEDKGEMAMLEKQRDALTRIIANLERE